MEVREWTHEGRPELTAYHRKAQPGPWYDEPDKRHWISEAGLDCLMVRNHFGIWCGYVAVTEGHPYFGVGYGNCPLDCTESYCNHVPENVVSVHGGLTYADFCRESEDGEGHGICHVPYDGRPEKVWWLGFDTGHYMDYQPGMPGLSEGNDRVSYKDVAYVQGECEDLAKQLTEVTTERLKAIA